MKQLAIIGACGHGKVLADIASKMGYKNIVFLDDYKDMKEYGGYPLIGKSDEAGKGGYDIAIAIGNPNVRKSFQEQLEYMGINIPVLIHPDAVIAEDSAIGLGTVIMAGAVICPGSVVGKGCIINTCTSVDHDCIVKDYVHIAVGGHLAGEVVIGASTWIGAGATVSNSISICGGCIGAGAVVVRNIEKAGTYIGVPAKEIEYGRY